MGECTACGKQLDLPFTCAYCGEQFCAEHRLPESHNCPSQPKEPPQYIKERIPQEPRTKQTLSENQPSTQNGEFVSEGPLHFRRNSSSKKRKRRRGVVLLIGLMLTIFLIAFIVIWGNPSLLTHNLMPNSNSNSLPSPTASITSQLPTPYITTTPQATPTSSESYTYLVSYTLALINTDRQSYGLQNVTLSSINSGQQHADEMLQNGYFSHWDMQGYKPYMRYTLAGGRGAVDENCAWQGITGNIFGIDVKSTLSKLEYSMMNDDPASNWGHRDNILTPSHNKVSIGIAYDNHNVYLVQDFEDDYINWTLLASMNGIIEMQGIVPSGVTISQVAIHYDSVSPLTVEQLSNAPYQDGYDSGTYVGQIVSPPPQGTYYQQPSEGILIQATTWVQTGQSFNINFNLASAFSNSGTGVYTLYLWTDSNTYLTTYSIWNT